MPSREAAVLSRPAVCSGALPAGPGGLRRAGPDRDFQDLPHLATTDRQPRVLPRWDLLARTSRRGDGSPHRTPGLVALRRDDPLIDLAWSGSEHEARTAIAKRLRTATGEDARRAHYASVILDVGLGNYDAALAHGLPLYRDDPPELGTLVLPEIVEAATRGGIGFDAAGAGGFTRRALVELAATAEHRTERSEDLTPQEANVARLVATGASNRQVAERLFITTHTVDYHIRKIFRKLGVESRTQLVRILLTEAGRP